MNYPVSTIIIGGILLKLAIFDFDGTLFPKDSLKFLLSEWKRLEYSKLKYYKIFSSLFILFFYGTYSFLYCWFSQSALSCTISIGNRGFTTALFHVRRRLLHQIFSLTNRTIALHCGGMIVSKERDRVASHRCLSPKKPAWVGLLPLRRGLFRDLCPDL
jgi:hypothetical protein